MCQLKLYKLGFWPYRQNDPAYKYQSWEMFRMQIERMDSLNRLRERIIDSCKIISIQKQQIFKEIKVVAWWSQMTSYKQMLAWPQRNRDEGFADFYREHFLDNTPLDTTYSSTAYYGDMLFYKVMSDMIAKGYKVPIGKNQIEFSQYTTYLREHYKGSSEYEKLLTIAVSLLYKTNETSDSLLNSICTSMRYPFYKSVVNDIRSKYSLNRTAYNFALRNEKGKTVRLTDFRGKVVVVDYWFTGCTGCIDLARALEEPAKQLRQDTGIVFISINVDRERERWLTSLSTGRYTHPGFVTLNTNGKGVDEPSVSFYDFKSMPNMLVISKSGKILSSEKPNRAIPATITKFVDLISAAARQ